MGKPYAMVVLLMGALYLRICYAASLMNSSAVDHYSLLTIRKHLINSDSLDKNWSAETSFCSWIGVTCSPRQPRVMRLDLSSMGLRGSVAAEIGNLSFLTSLNMSNNNLSGLIPAEIGKLTRLEGLYLGNNNFNGQIPTTLSSTAQLTALDLSYNNLSGNIPLSFGNLSHLQQLNLRSNQFTGEIPKSIFNISSLVTLNVGDNTLSGSIPEHLCNTPATKLEYLRLFFNNFGGEIPSAIMRCHSLQQLRLGFNKLEGTIPPQLWNLSTLRRVALDRNQLGGTISPSIGNLSNLQTLFIDDNSFQGAIPQEIGQLSRLTGLSVSFNKFNGEVPQSVFNLSRLEELWLGFNHLSGNLPSAIDKSFPNIKYLDVAGNIFHGRIPSSVCNLSALILLQLSANLFTGEIPMNLGDLRQLERLRLHNNQLTNDLSKPEQDFLSPLTNCNHLVSISVSDNPITGVLPKSLGSTNLSASLQTLHASSCRIVGPIPYEVGNLSSLIKLRLWGNDLTGLLPTALGHLSNMQLFSVSQNKLQGSISPVLCNLKKLYFFDISENRFSGQIPRCLPELPFLRRIYLDSNGFSSLIPSSLWLATQFEMMNLSNNHIEGSLPQEIGNLKSLIKLDLSGNQLSGEIPDTISKLQNLVTLSLSNNKLDGPLSDSFSELKGLKYLDISCNNLSGPIPKSFEALTYLEYFNVSFNQLTGEIPDGGPFANYTSQSFVGNKGLCGAPRFDVEECKGKTLRPSRMIHSLKYILPAIGLVVLLVAAFIVFLMMRNRPSSTAPPSDIPPALMLVNERISYNEILRATNNFDESHLIGRGGFGSVYKGFFSDNMVAAVKVFDLTVQGAFTSFDTECLILRSIRHRNLVKVITSCSNLDFKALVLAFMPNHNLEKWLYSSSCSLNIFQRFGIMEDVATALEYLHEGYSSLVVHCDLKPQNILLDEDMVAHVADFGIAKLLTQEHRMHHTKTYGTIGYMAPEYGSDGLVSTMVDVYSYGILVMEICSRRKPTDEMFCGELTMRAWMLESFPNSIDRVVDNELLDMDDQSRRVGYKNCLASAIELALECTTNIPQERPAMKDVAVRIKKIKSNLSNSCN